MADPFDDKLRQSLRMQNIFGTPPFLDTSTGRGTFTGQPMTGNQIGPNMGNQFAPEPMPNLRQSTSPMQSSPQDLTMGDLYNPETRATEMLYELLKNRPERKEPNIWHRIAAMAAGGFTMNPDVGAEVAYPGFNRKMKDFEARYKPVLDAASQERQSNVNLRQIATTALADQDRNRQLDITQQRADTAEKRAESYIALNKFKMDYPDMEITAPEGGNYTLIDPKGIKPSVNTGISVGSISKEREIELRIQGAKEVAAIPRTTYTSGTTTSTSVTPQGPMDPTQKKVDEYIKARKMINKHPDLQKNGLIVLADPGTNDFTIAPAASPTWLSGGFDADFRRRILEYIYNDGPEPEPKVSTSTSTRQGVSVRGGGGVPVVRPKVETKVQSKTEQAVPVPPLAQRVIGKTYILGNGTLGIWDGSAFDPVPGGK